MKHGIQQLVISKRNPQHQKQCGILVHVQKTSSAKRLLVRGEVDSYCHWQRRRRETADVLGENESARKMKKSDRSVSKLKQQVARSEKDPRFAAADRNFVASIEYRCTSLSTPGSRLKSLGQQSSSPSICLIFTRRLLPRDHDQRRNWPHTERRQKVSDATSKKVSGRRFKTRSVGLVEAETFFCLA